MERPQLVQEFITLMGALGSPDSPPPSLEHINAAFNHINTLRQMGSRVRVEQHMIALQIVEQFAFSGEYAGDFAALGSVMNLLLDLENNYVPPNMVPAQGVATFFDSPVQQVQQLSAGAGQQPIAGTPTPAGIIPDPWAGFGAAPTNTDVAPPGVSVHTNGAARMGVGNPFEGQQSYATAPQPHGYASLPMRPQPQVPAGPQYLYKVTVETQVPSEVNPELMQSVKHTENVVAPNQGVALSKCKLLNAAEETDGGLSVRIDRQGEVTF